MIPIPISICMQLIIITSGETDTFLICQDLKIWYVSADTYAASENTTTSLILLKSLIFGSICNVCAVLLANHLRSVADAFRSLRIHQHYWLTDRWISPKWSHSNPYHITCGESRKYISERNQNAQSDGNRTQPLNSF